MFTDADADRLKRIEVQLSGPWGGWEGGSVGPDGRPFSHTLVDWARRTDVHLAVLTREAVRKLDELLARQPVNAVFDSVEVDGVALFTADQVRSLIREALAEPLPMYLTTSKETPA